MLRVDSFQFHQVNDLFNHPPYCRPILVDDGLRWLREAKRLKRSSEIENDARCLVPCNDIDHTSWSNFDRLTLTVLR